MGQATTFVHKALEVGDKIILTGPYGDFYLQEDSNREMICIAGGSGKAPNSCHSIFLKGSRNAKKSQIFLWCKIKKRFIYDRRVYGT